MTPVVKGQLYMGPVITPRSYMVLYLVTLK